MHPNFMTLESWYPGHRNPAWGIYTDISQIWKCEKRVGNNRPALLTLGNAWHAESRAKKLKATQVKTKTYTSKNGIYMLLWQKHVKLQTMFLQTMPHDTSTWETSSNNLARETMVMLETLKAFGRLIASHLVSLITIITLQSQPSLLEI